MKRLFYIDYNNRHYWSVFLFILIWSPKTNNTKTFTFNLVWSEELLATETARGGRATFPQREGVERPPFSRKEAHMPAYRSWAKLIQCEFFKNQDCIKWGEKHGGRNRGGIERERMGGCILSKQIVGQYEY